MNNLFNNEVYWDCLQGTLIYEFHFYHKPNCSIYAQGRFKQFPATQFFIPFNVLNFKKTYTDL